MSSPTIQANSSTVRTSHLFYSKHLAVPKPNVPENQPPHNSATHYPFAVDLAEGYGTRAGLTRKSWLAGCDVVSGRTTSCWRKAIIVQARKGRPSSVCPAQASTASQSIASKISATKSSRDFIKLRAKFW